MGGMVRVTFVGLGLGLAFMLGCSRTPESSGPRAPLVSGAQSRARAAWVQELEALGYFKGLREDQIGRLKESFLRQGWTALFSGPAHRMNPAAAEDLAQGGVGEFIASLRPFLLRENVRLPTIRDERTNSGYMVQVGEQSRVIYTRDEQRREEAGEPRLTWGLSVARTFAIVNELLVAARSEERLFAVDGGNDLFAIFLTPELRRLILSHPEAEPTEAPYVPTETYPNFGQPVWQDWVESPGR